MPREHVDESELHAFVDGELDAERRRRIEGHLQKNQEDAALVEGWRRQNAALRVAFASAAKEPLPAALRRPGSDPGRSFGSGVNWARFSPSKASSLRSMRRSDTGRRLQRRPAIAVSILTLLAVAIVAGAALLAFTGPATPPDKAARIAAAPGFTARAQIAYLTFAQDPRPVEIDADQKTDLTDWLANRAGFGGVPNLSSSGLDLLGGRLVPGVAGPAGLLLYQMKSGARVGLYFERAGADAAPVEPPKTAPGLLAVEWRAGGMAFVLLGPVAGDVGRAIAESAASQVLRRD